MLRIRQDMIDAVRELDGKVLFRSGRALVNATKVQVRAQIGGADLPGTLIGIELACGMRAKS